MADQNTSIVTNDNLLAVYLEARGLKTLHEEVQFMNLVAPENRYKIPKGMGNQITFSRWRKIPAASTTLAEASSNSAVVLSSKKYNSTIVSYGRTVKFTDLFEITSVLDVNEGALTELEQSAALTVDNAIQRAVFKNVLAEVGQNANTKTKIFSVQISAPMSSLCADTGTSNQTDQQYGFPCVHGASVTRLSAVSKTAPSISARLGPIAIRKAVNRLRRLAARPFADGKYRGVIHPNAWTTMMGNPDWKQWHINFSGGPQESMFKHEVGLVHGVRLLESPNCPRYAVAAHSINLTFICGPQALAATDFASKGGIEYIITRPGPQSTNDPFHLNSYVAYKTRMVATPVNPSAGVIVCSAELL